MPCPAPALRLAILMLGCAGLAVSAGPASARTTASAPAERPTWAELPDEVSRPAPAPAPPGPAGTTPPEAAGADAPPAIAVSGDPNQTGPGAELLAVDRQLSDVIFDAGPLAGYGAAISADGMLYDSNGPSAAGPAGVEGRFAGFPPDLKLERRPQRAMASGTSGSSWGIFAVRRGEQTLTEGFYVTSWRREADGWRIVAELAAGRAPPPATLPARPATPAPAVPQLREPGAAATGSAAPSPLEPARVLRDALGRPVTPRGPAPSAPSGQPAPGPAAQSQPPAGR